MLPDRMLASPAFVRDMRMFLELPIRVLFGISEIGDSSEGFAAESQGRILSERFDLGIDTAARALRLAEYIYNRASNLNLETDDAAAQFAAAASNLEDPVSVDGERKDAVRGILSFKRDYEIARARNVTATSGAPHFIGVNGSWNVKPVRVRNGEVVKVPILAMNVIWNVIWHDGSENNREVFLQMSAEDWADFQSDIASIEESRKDAEYMANDMASKGMA